MTQQDHGSTAEVWSGRVEQQPEHAFILMHQHKHCQGASDRPSHEHAAAPHPLSASPPCMQDMEDETDGASAANHKVPQRQLAGLLTWMLQQRLMCQDKMCLPGSLAWLASVLVYSHQRGRVACRARLGINQYVVRGL